MKYFIVDEQTLAQVNQIILEMPTKFGMPLGNLLDRNLKPYTPPAPAGGDQAKDKGE